MASDYPDQYSYSPDNISLLDLLAGGYSQQYQSDQQYQQPEEDNGGGGLLGLARRAWQTAENIPVTAALPALGPLAGGIEGIRELANRLGLFETDVPTVGQVYEASRYPSVKANELTQDVIPGPTGRILGAAAQTVLDPMTIATLPFGGEGLLANLVGRGTMNIPRFLALMAASGAGAEAAREGADAAGLGDTAQIVAGLAGGALTGGVSSRLLGSAAQDARAVASFADSAQSWGTRDTPFRKLDDGNFLVDAGQLDTQIPGRFAHSNYLRQNPEQAATQFATDEGLALFDSNTEALKNVRSWLAETGRSQVTVADPYEFGRNLGGFYESRQLVAETTAGAVNATKKAATADQWLSYTEGIANQRTASSVQEALSSAKTAEAQSASDLRDMVPAGYKSNLRQYLSGAVRGNEDVMATAERRLSGLDNWGEVKAAVDSHLGLRQTARQAQGELDGLGTVVQASRPRGVATAETGASISLLNNRTNMETEVASLQGRLAGIDQQAQAVRDRLASTATPEEKAAVVQMSGGVAVQPEGQIRPEVLQDFQQLSELNAQKTALTSELGTRQSMMDLLDNQLIQSRETGRAYTARLQQEAEVAATRATEAKTAYQDSLAKIESSLGPVDPSSLAGAAVTRFKNVSDIILNRIAGTASKGDESAIEGALNAYQSTIPNFLPQSFNDRFDNYFQPLVHRIPNMSARATVNRLFGMWNQAERNIDPWAHRSGALGWMRRRIGGTLINDSRAEGWLNTFHAGRSTADIQAAIQYGPLVDDMQKVIGGELSRLAKGTDTAAANARAMADLRPAQQMEAYMQQAVRSVKDKSWQSLKQHGLSDDEISQLRELAGSNPVVAALHPEYFDWRKFGPDTRLILNVYKEGFNQITNLAKAEGVDAAGLVNQMIRPELRESFAARGELLKPDGTTVHLKPAERTMLTDLAEVQARLKYGEPDTRMYQLFHNSLPDAVRNEPLQLNQIFASPTDMATAIPGNLLWRLNQKPAYEKAGEIFLKDAKDASKLRSGETLSPASFKSKDLYDDWQVIKDVIQPGSPTGYLRYMDKAADGMSRLTAGVLGGDLSLAGVQGLSYAYTHPQGAMRLIGQKARSILTDEGWHAHFSEPENQELLLRAIESGLGFGASSIKGGEGKFHNIWELIPGLRPIGKGIRNWDDIAFERGLMMMKLDAVKASMSDVQLLRAAPRDVATRILNSIPGLKSVHDAADLWGSTNEDQFNAIVRTVNNQLGSLPRSQMATGAVRNSLERIFLMVPGYFRGRTGLLNQTARLFRSADNGGIEGRLAASILGREVLAAGSISATLAAMTGNLDDWEQNSIDPRRGSRFLSLPLGDGSYIPFLPTSSAIRLYSEIAAGMPGKSGQFTNPKDALLGRTQAVTDFFTGRENPVMSMISQQVKGRDFFGRELDTPLNRLENAAQAVLPLYMGQGLQTGYEQSRTGQFDPKELALTTGAQFLGRNYNPPSATKELNSAFHAWQGQQYPDQPMIDWADAPSDIKKLARNDQNISRFEQQSIAEQARRASANDQSIDLAFREADERNSHFDTLLSAASARAMNGDITLADWKNRYSDLQQNRAESSQVLRQGLSSLGFDIQGRGAEKTQRLIDGVSPQIATAIAEYRSVSPQQFQKDNTYVTDGGPVLSQDIDWNAYRQAQQSVLAKYPQNVRDSVASMVEPTDPVAQRYSATQQNLDSYFSTPKYQGFNSDQGHYIDYIMASLRNTAEAATKSGMDTLDASDIYQAAIRSMVQSGDIQNQTQLGLASVAFRFLENPQTRTQSRNPEAIIFMLNNPDLFRFYPWMLNELPSRLQRLLPQDAQGISSQSQIASRTLAGTSIGSIQ